MRLLFLNSLKGIKKKKLQMLGLIVLVMISTAIYTTMNSALDRMDSMAEAYMETQQVEHMTVFLNETDVLTREHLDDMFRIPLQAEWEAIRDALEPVVITDEMLLEMDQDQVAALREQVRQAMIAQFIAAGFSSTLAEQMATPTAVDIVLKNQIGQRMAGPNYLMEVLQGEQPINDVNAYLFFGCAAKSSDTSTNLDSTRPWATFCPTEREDSDEPTDSCSTTDSSEETSNVVTRLYERFNSMTSGSAYGVDKYVYLNDAMDELAETYGLVYELRASKVVTYEVDGDDQSYVTGAFIYDANAKLNKPFLLAGRFPSNDNEITVSDTFAAHHHLDLNDTYSMSGVDYTVVGYAYVPDYIYPALSFNTPLYDASRHTVMYMNAATYAALNGRESRYYSARLIHYEGTHTDPELETLVDAMSEDPKIMFLMSTATISPRLSTFTLEVENNRIFTSYLMYILLGIAVFIIIMVMKKRIEDERLQIGVLKSLGYKTYSIAAGYLVYPVVGSLAGGALGYGLGIILQSPIVQLYRAFYNVPMNEFVFNSRYLLMSLGVPLAALVTLSYAVALFMLRHRPLKLLREGSNLKVNALSRAMSRLIHGFPFKARFRYSLAFRSLGKLLAITLCSFATGLLLVLTLIGSTMMNKVIEKTFGGMHYQYRVQYDVTQNPSLDPSDDHPNEDLMLNSSLTLVAVQRGDQTETLEKERSLTASGVERTLNLVTIQGKDGQDISELLWDEYETPAIIVNETVRVLYDLHVGDVLMLSKRVSISESQQCGDVVPYQVVGIDYTYNGLIGYVTKPSLTEYLGYEDHAYNLIYTTELKPEYQESNEDIKNVFRFDDLRENLAMAMEMMNLSLYIVIGFAGAMALVIISVVSNIVVDENRKHISLMKVMGYRDREIKSVVLNIYTPFVVLAYLASIPAMIALLQYIISLLAEEISFSAPIELSWMGALIGLGVILSAYFIALQFSRRALNQVPLSEALKRE